MKKAILILLALTVSVAMAAKKSDKKDDDKPEIVGLICDQPDTGGGIEIKIKLTITVNKDKANILVQTDRYRPIGQIKVASKSVKAILDDKLADMNNKTIADTDSRTTLAFRVDGSDYKGRPRLGVIINSNVNEKLKMKLKSCITDIKYKYRMY